jgi:CheY-like chemotaxis protein
MTQQTNPGKRKVLVVDDDPGDRTYAEKILRKNYNVIEATNGIEAMQLIQNNKPDIILMDIMMPHGDGFTTCAHIKANKATQSIPVIMLTGVDHKLDKQWAKSIGADGYIVKPFKPEELLNTISKLLESSR